MLKSKGYSVGGLHGDLSQTARIDALQKFKSGQTRRMCFGIILRIVASSLPSPISLSVSILKGIGTDVPEPCTVIDTLVDRRGGLTYYTRETTILTELQAACIEDQKSARAC